MVYKSNFFKFKYIFKIETKYKNVNFNIKTNILIIKRPLVHQSRKT